MKKKSITLALILALTLTQSLAVFASSTSTEGNVNSQVTSTKAPTWSVSVPDITLDAATGVGTGDVSITADLGSEDTLQVNPAATITMKQTGKADIVAEVSMAKQTWSMTELLGGPVTQPVSITSTTPLTAGTYTGSLVYTVSLGEYVKTRAELFADKDIFVINDSYINGNHTGFAEQIGVASVLSNKYSSTLETAYATPTQTRMTRITNPTGPVPDIYLHEAGPALIADNTTYDENDIVILSGGYECRWGGTQYMDFREWDGEYVVGVGTEYVYAMNKVKAAQAAKGINAPIVYIKPDFTYVKSAEFEASWNAVFEDQRIKDVNTGNVIFIDVAELGVLPVDYIVPGAIYAQSGLNKIEQAVEDALYEYYTK